MYWDVAGYEIRPYITGITSVIHLLYHPSFLGGALECAYTAWSSYTRLILHLRFAGGLSVFDLLFAKLLEADSLNGTKAVVSTGEEHSRESMEACCLE